MREILEHVGFVQESLSSNVLSSSQVIANVANPFNIRDIELSSFLVAMTDLSLRKMAVEEKRSKVQQESKELVDYIRKAIERLTCLKRSDGVDIQATLAEWTGQRTVLDLFIKGKHTGGCDGPVVVVEDENVKLFPVIPLSEEEILDTNGAGDAFVGGLMSQLVLDRPTEECVRAYMYAASVVIQMPGVTYPNDVPCF
ncbi:adenosine kinase 2 [Phtheirospermum japonicum]|uniref:Adenosine kinase 2 n=1 Tax=Phtheirospermum japonicum TaxID=374723 RepID=A0A830CFC7_9LAMI|nr:adenosine kinase 2 [Phtheirospermum japonicum]